MSSKLKKAIGAVKDQTSISLAKVSSNTTSSNLEVTVLKATSHDAVPIEEKYVHGILRLVSSNKAHAAACASAIGKRIGRTRNWVVALKSLMLILRIFQDGDPYFPREVLHAMKRGAKILNLSSFRDDSNSSPWDFTSFIRTFALYLDERLESFLTGKLQHRSTQEDSGSGSGSGSTYQRSKSRVAMRPKELVRDMKPAMLLDKMSHWQRLLDRAIAMRPTGAAKKNHLVNISLYAIVQESFDLYKDISDGLTRVLDSFFHLQYQNCVTAFQTCIKAAKQFEELTAFYIMCKSLGVGRSSEYPCVQVISEELIETLQEFLKDQSSFPSADAKTANRLLDGPPGSPSSVRPGSPSSVRPRSGRNNSFGRQSNLSSPRSSAWQDRSSEFGSQCASLDDLISATETGVSPSISIDLEAYSASERDDAFGVSNTGSSRSLPITSASDLVSIEEWMEENERDEDHDEHQDQDQEEEQQRDDYDDEEVTEKGISDSMNWEMVLAETISSPSPAFSQPLSDTANTSGGAFPAQPLSDMNTNTFDALPAQTTSSTLSPRLSDNYTNTFEAFTEQPPAAGESPPATATATGWDLASFEAPPPQQPLPNIQVAPNDHYNPFLADPFEVSNPEPASSVLTFRAAPTFSAQNPNQIENDPFASGAEFSGEDKFGSPIDHQNFQHEQQLWLQNQNKIIAKHCS